MNNMKKLRKAKGLSQKELAEMVELSDAQISLIERGKRKPSFETLLKIAEALDCESSDLYSERKNRPGITDAFVSFPIIGEVAAGYGRLGEEDWTNGEIDIPLSWLRGRSREEYFVLRVTGDSMYPMYQDGDLVLVLSQHVMDHNGQIAVVQYEHDNATIKRVEQSTDAIKLCPVNPQFPPLTIRGEALTQFTVMGIPKMLIRSVE